MKGWMLFLSIVVMAIAAAVLCCPAAVVAGDASDNVMQFIAADTNAAKTPDAAPAWLRGVPDPPSTSGVLAGVVVTKEKIKHSARVRTRGFFRQGVRLNWPMCVGGVCRGG